MIWAGWKNCLSLLTIIVLPPFMIATGPYFLNDGKLFELNMFVLFGVALSLFCTTTKLTFMEKYVSGRHIKDRSWIGPMPIIVWAVIVADLIMDIGFVSHLVVKDLGPQEIIPPAESRIAFWWFMVCATILVSLFGELLIAFLMNDNVVHEGPEPEAPFDDLAAATGYPRLGPQQRAKLYDEDDHDDDTAVMRVEAHEIDTEVDDEPDDPDDPLGITRDSNRTQSFVPARGGG